MAVCTPVPSQCLEDTIAAKMSAAHGASAAGALVHLSHLKGSRTFSIIDRPFRDPDYGSFVEPENKVPVVVFGVGSVNNLIRDFELYGLRKGDWEFTIIVPGTGPRLLVKDPKSNPFIKKLDADNMPVGGYTAALPAPSTVIVNAQKDLSILMDKGVIISLCLNAATAAYGYGLFKNPALLEDPSKPAGPTNHKNPDLMDQLFDRRIVLTTSGVANAVDLVASGVGFWELH